MRITMSKQTVVIVSLEQKEIQFGDSLYVTCVCVPINSFVTEGSLAFWNRGGGRGKGGGGYAMGGGGQYARQEPLTIWGFNPHA